MQQPACSPTCTPHPVCVLCHGPSALCTPCSAWALCPARAQLPPPTPSAATHVQVDSVRVFPVKAYAFVNYAEIACAIKAMTALEGVAIPSLTGVRAALRCAGSWYPLHLACMSVRCCACCGSIAGKKGARRPRSEQTAQARAHARRLSEAPPPCNALCKTPLKACLVVTLR